MAHSWERKTKVVAYDDGETKVAVTVRAATVLDGIVHDRLVMQAVEQGDDEKPDEYLARVVFYPAIRAATCAVEGMEWPISLEQFLELPQSFGQAWMETAFEMNPQWSPSDGSEKDGEKKTGTVSISG